MNQIFEIIELELIIYPNRIEQNTYNKCFHLVGVDAVHTAEMIHTPVWTFLKLWRKFKLLHFGDENLSRLFIRHWRTFQ